MRHRLRLTYLFRLLGLGPHDAPPRDGEEDLDDGQRHVDDADADARHVRPAAARHPEECAEPRHAQHHGHAHDGHRLRYINLHHGPASNLEW